MFSSIPITKMTPRFLAVVFPNVCWVVFLDLKKSISRAQSLFADRMRLTSLAHVTTGGSVIVLNKSKFSSPPLFT